MCKKIIISILSVFAVVSLWGQDNKQDTLTLTLEQYRQRVYNYSQELKQAREGVDAADSQVRAVKTGFLPKLAISADGNYQLNTIDFSMGAGAPLSLKPWGYSVGATISQNIYSGGAVRTQYELAQMGAEIAREAERLTIDNIFYVADIHYWSLTANFAMLSIAISNVELLNDLYIIVKNRYEDGLIAKNDLLMIETRKVEAELQRTNLEKRFVASRVDLKVLMGYDINEKVKLIYDIDKESEFPKQVTLEEVLKIRPEYQIASKQILIEKKNLIASLSQFRPQVVAGFTGSYGSQQLNLDGEGFPNGIVFGQVNIPVFEWNKKKHIKAVGNSNINKSTMQQTIVKDEILSQLELVMINLELTASEVKVAVSALSIAQESLDINTLSYNEGRLTVLDVLSSQMSWLLSYNNLISIHLQYKVALSQYNKVVGVYNSMDLSVE